MSAGPQLFRVNSETRESDKVEEVNFARLGLQERRDIQEWIAANPGILGDDLLIVGKEFSGFDRTSERLDLLAVDQDGKLVVIELKRDDTGADAHWQAIKYASYLSDASQEDIVGMLARYESVSQDEAATRLLQHLGADDLNALNNDQRIVLASHRFAPEVTSAVPWLNEKAPGNDLITCVQLTPYHDAEFDSLYIQANTIIPVQGVEDLIIGIGDGQELDGGSGRGQTALVRTFARNRSDEVTTFLRRVADVALEDMPSSIRPDRRSRWAGQQYSSNDYRYYHLWYSRRPWGNWSTSYRVDLDRSEESQCRVIVHFVTDIDELMGRLENLQVQVSLDGESLDESFANEIADALRRMVQSTTPAVDEFENERNEE